ncbi:MAG: C40 family peptidase [Crocinitomicaceae bacterium]
MADKLTPTCEHLVHFIVVKARDRIYFCFMRWMLVIFSVLIFEGSVLSQDKKIDQLEVLYDQGYYHKVYRKSRKLLADPAYDYSGLPSYYLSLSIFRLAGDPKWYKHHKNCIEEAVESYRQFSEHPSYADYLNAHYYEISSIKTYLDKLGRNLKDQAYSKDAEMVFDFSFKYFKEIKGKPDTHENLDAPDLANGQSSGDAYREKIVVYAKSLVGIKYVWAGADESGFDCSGFTSYVLKKFGIIVSRTASGQMEEAKKVKIENAQKADLVFFGSDAKITHVGMVVSNKGDELTMVHASTSKGVIVTNIEQSTYWKPKLKGAGTYLE